ncbi:MAG: adenylate/guanylate cyclase domain-containing protein [bacterium]
MSSNILLVDDSKTIRTHVRSILQHAEDDYKVVDKEDGYEALKWLTLQPQKALPDLVILDRNMPNMSGDDCIRVLKSDRLWKRIPVLFLTAQVEMTELVKGLAELEAEDYLPKPFDPREFLARVKVLIRIKKAEDLTHQLNSDLEHSLVLQKQAYDELKTTKIKLAETEAAAKLTGVFEKFVPKEFMNRIAPEGLENLIFGHAESDFVTILFSDIRAFTEISENLSPQELMDFLNGYLREMNPPIMEHHGFVDKFIGDAIMAVFDQPDKTNADEAENALDAALGMQKVLVQLNQKRKKLKLDPVSIGIGIHSGNVIIGTVGFEERMDSTVLGDAVNLASRLEGLTKFYGCSLIISEDTHGLLSNQKKYHTRELDRVMVKGRKTPLNIHEVFNGDEEEKINLKLEFLDTFQEGMNAYRKRQWKKGLSEFKECRKAAPTDPVYQVYIGRCENFITQSPPKNWNGVYEFQEK